MRDGVTVSAPGKVMVSGEYVVLDGAPAIVAAAPARAIGRLSPQRSDRSPGRSAGSPDSASLPPEALLSRRRAEEALGALPASMTLSVDTSALKSDGRKIGLGSSAATAAATVAAVAALHGQDPSDPETRARLLPLALEGHRAVAPEGSGADVAASMLGGFVRFRRDRERVLEAAPVAWPPSLHLALVWTGTPARTSDLVARVKALAARDPRAYGHASDRLREAAGALLAAIERADAGAAIDACRAHHDAMHLLGETAGAPIVTDSLSKAAAVAAAVGGAAKPSGAGGGDVAIAFLPSERARADLAGACHAAGLTLLPMTLGDDGPRLEPAA